MSRSLGYMAAFGFLAAVTIGAALSLTWPNAHMGSRIAGDPETSAELAASWRVGAVFAYTSGSLIGHICALIAGYLAAHWSSPREGVLAGFAIGMVNVTATGSMAMLATHDPATMHGLLPYADPNPLHQPAVLVSLAVVLGGAVGFGAIGSRVADPPRHRWLAMAYMVALVPVLHYLVTLLVMGGALDPLTWLYMTF